MFESCGQVAIEALICIDNKYGVTKFTNLYKKKTLYFSYLSTKTSCVTVAYRTVEQCGCRYWTL